MNSAINAYEDGFLSYGNMLENLASNGGEINEMKKLSPVEAQMVGNNLNIVVYANASNVEGDAEFASNVSYKSIVIKGIEAFSGQIEGININVKVRYGESNSHKTINVEFYHGNKRSYAYGYTSVVYSAAKDPEEGDAVRNIIYTTAHEAGGHCAFRLQDAYRDAFSNRPNLKNVDSIMNNHYGGVTDLDRAMLVRAYKLGDFTKEIYFQDNTDLLDKYSKRWGWQ